MTSLKTTLPILTFITFQLFASRAPALPTVTVTGQYTDRFLPTLPDPVIPPGDHLQVFAVIQTTDPPGSPTITVTASQGDAILTLDRFQIPGGPSNFYWGFIDFDANLTGAWEITPTDSIGTGASAFTDALFEPELLPYVESITLKDSPIGASVEWALPDLTGFDVETAQVRIVQVTPRTEVFVIDLPADTTSFEPLPGVLQYGVEYVYNVGLYDVEGDDYTENRSVAQSQSFRFVLPGDFNLDGAVDAADLAQWQGDFGQNANSDADNDNDSDGADFLGWQRQFHSGLALVASSPAVPEPTSLALATALALLTYARKFSRR